MANPTKTIATVVPLELAEKLEKFRDRLNSNPEECVYTLKHTLSSALRVLLVRALDKDGKPVWDTKK